jgi:predicted XRE-type DNA-binding protein
MKRDHEKSSGNVFADLGFRNAKQELLKAKLTVEIYKLLKRRGLTQQEAAKLLGTTQAQISARMRCKPVSVSVGRLMEFLMAFWPERTRFLQWNQIMASAQHRGAPTSGAISPHPRPLISLRPQHADG